MRFVKAATLRRLVEALSTDDGELDTTFVNVFLATYRTYARPDEVLDLLLDRYKCLYVTTTTPPTTPPTTSSPMSPPQLQFTPSSCSSTATATTGLASAASNESKHKDSLIKALHVWLDGYPEDWHQQNLKKIFAFTSERLSSSEIHNKVTRRLGQIARERAAAQEMPSWQDLHQEHQQLHRQHHNRHHHQHHHHHHNQRSKNAAPNRRHHHHHHHSHGNGNGGHGSRSPAVVNNGICDDYGGDDDVGYDDDHDHGGGDDVCLDYPNYSTLLFDRIMHSTSNKYRGLTGGSGIGNGSIGGTNDGNSIMNGMRAMPAPLMISPYAHFMDMYQFPNVSAPHFAGQLTRLDVLLFKRLIPHQCLGGTWARRAADKEEVHTVLATIEQFNAVLFAVTSSVLVEMNTRPAERAAKLAMWIDIAKELRVLKNFSSLKAIVSGLQSNPIYRLRKTWEALEREKVMVNEAF